MDKKIADILNEIERRTSSKYSDLNEYKAFMLVLGGRDPDLVRELQDLTSVPLFRQAGSWADLLALYIVHAQGFLPGTPTIFGPLVDDTARDVLENIMRHGAIVINSERGKCDNKIRQRAHVEFLANKKSIDVDALYARLAANKNILVHVRTADGHARHSAASRLHSWDSVDNNIPDPHPDSSYTTFGDRRAIVLETQWNIDIWTPADSYMIDGDTDDLYSWEQIKTAADPRIDVSDDDVVYFRVVHAKFCEADVLGYLNGALDAGAARAKTRGTAAGGASSTQNGRGIRGITVRRLSSSSRGSNKKRRSAKKSKNKKSAKKRKRSSCRKIIRTSAFLDRPSPPCPAKIRGCKGVTRRGNDGTRWVSKRTSAGTYRWIRKS